MIMCDDCKHFHKTIIGLKCRVNEEPRVAVGNDYSRVVYHTRPLNPSIQVMRSPGAECGPEAKLFKKKNWLWRWFY